MTKTVKRKNIRTTKKTYSSPFGIYWEKKNYFFLFLGFALLVIGYYVMSLGNWDSVTALIVSPIILCIAYLLIFPASILYKKKEENPESTEQEIASGKS